jgi:methylthioribose-1-phosphate isomerase
MSCASDPRFPAALEWHGGPEGYVEMIDQTRLPLIESQLRIDGLDQMIDAIRRLAVRGAPAIGIAAAYGLVIGTREGIEAGATLREAFERSEAALRASRPTAVNLGWALDRMRSRMNRETSANLDALHAEALAIHREDRALCRAIGEAGATLIPEGGRMLTHCNAGALATGGIGTALALCYVARERGRHFEVFADETRPLLQGARLTAWELQRQNIPVTVLCDGAAASLMRDGGIDLVVTGADRITARGDVANKIGTYGLALLACAHGIPFYVAAPSSTFDLELVTGAEIPIEERAHEEILEPFGARIAPPGIGAYAPAFDVTPAELISGLITERGLLRNPEEASVRRHLA